MATEHLKNDRNFPVFCLCSLIFWFAHGEIFLKFPILWKWTNILQEKKYGVVQTVSPISRDFLFLAIKLNCSDRFSWKTDISKILFVSQNVQSFKKIHWRKREKIHCYLCFLWLCWRHKISGKIYVFMWAHADYWSLHHQRSRGHKTIGSHLKLRKDSLITCALKRDAQIVFCKGFYFFLGISHSPRTPLGHAHR